MDKTELLKELIDGTGLNIKAFSEKAGLPYSTLRSILSRGVDKASVDNVIKICAALDIKVDDLYEMAEKDSLIPISKEKDIVDTIAAHFEGKNITPKKMKLIEQYIDALFEDDDE